MNQEIKKQWQEALTSGKYEKTKGALKRTSDYPDVEFCYCGLGVLCELYSKEKGIAWEPATNPDPGNFYYLHGNEGVLPYQVRIWAGLDTQNPWIGEGSAITLNDSNGLSFKELAEEIEKHL